MPAPATSKWGWNGEEWTASLRVRTGPKALRAVGGSFFKLWESKEKLTGRNTLPAVCKTKGLRNCREEPPHPRWRKEAEGRGKGQTQPQRSHPLPHCKQALVPIWRLPETRPASCAGAAEGKGAPHPGRARANLWLPEPLATEGKGWPHPGRSRQNFWLPGRNTASASHTQRHLPAVPCPPRSRTELS